MRASLVVSHGTIFMVHIFYFIYYDLLTDSAHNFLARDCPLTLKIMASELSVNKELIMCVIITDIDKRKICVKFCAPQFA